MLISPSTVIETSDTTDGATLEGRIERYGEIRRALEHSPNIDAALKQTIDRYLEGIIMGVYGMLHNPEFAAMPMTAPQFVGLFCHAYAAGRDWTQRAFRENANQQSFTSGGQSSIPDGDVRLHHALPPK